MKSIPAVLQYELAADEHYDEPRVALVKKVIDRKEPGCT